MNTDPQQMHGIIAAFVGIYFVFYLLMAIAFMVPTGFIAKKAGLSPWLCLLCIFPLTGLILLYILAFIEWKVIPAPQMGWQPPYPPQPPFPPQA
jgi:Na+-driven multidrug efflux pump